MATRSKGSRSNQTRVTRRGKATAARKRKRANRVGRRSTGGARGGVRGRSTGATRRQDAIAVLKAEHARVDRLFEEFERATRGRGNGTPRKAELATQICRELQIHAAIEEEIFYPAAAAVVRDPELIPEATVEHQSARDLIAKIERMDPRDELYDATVMVLGEYVRHHVKEEQDELFPQLRRGSLDLRALGEQLRERRAQMELPA